MTNQLSPCYILDLVPSSSRSAAASALPLPQQLVPLLEEQFEIAKKAVEKALPANKRLSALEEAEYEYDDDDGALEKEIQLQGLCFFSSFTRIWC